MWIRKKDEKNMNFHFSFLSKTFRENRKEDCHENRSTDIYKFIYYRSSNIKIIYILLFLYQIYN